MKTKMKSKMKTKTKILVFIFKFYYGTSRPPYNQIYKTTHPRQFFNRFHAT